MSGIIVRVETGEYLKDCKCVKSLVDDLVVACDKIQYTLKSVVIILLAIACLLLLVDMIVKNCVNYKLNLLLEKRRIPGGNNNLPYDFESCVFY